MSEDMAYQSQETGEVSAISAEPTQEMTYTETLAAASRERANQAEPEQAEQETPTEEAQAPEKKEEKPVSSTIKVKFNHEEKEISLEEATSLIQKGMNYDKVHGKTGELEAALKARDEEVARRFGQQGLKTWDDLVRGWDTTQQQQQAQMVDQQFKAAVTQKAEEVGADPDLLMDIVNNLVGHHPKVRSASQIEQEAGQIKTQAEMQARIKQDAAAFKAAYPDVDHSTIPDEVWQRVDRGIPLVESYKIHENNLLKEKITALEQAQKVAKQNKKNAETSPGSVKGQGATAKDYISKETFDANKGDRRWVMNNLTAISQSRAKW